MSKVLVVAYGMGVDSTAMLVGLVWKRIRPDAILFADTGGEKDETYAYLPVIQEYLKQNGFPEVTVVRSVTKTFDNWPPYHTLEENCLTNQTLPSVAFGFQRKSCSLKWKAVPQHRWLKGFVPARKAWARGEKVVRAIGFDASPADSRRTYAASERHDKFYEFSYPLQEWGWDRERCKATIWAAGLPIPQKSSCFFCPAMKPDEVRALPVDKLRRIVAMEARARPRLTVIEGLWGNGCKGTRGGIKKPGRMSDLILEEKLLPAGEVEYIRKRMPLDLVPTEEADPDDDGYVPSWPDFRCGVNDELAGLSA